MLIEAPVRLSDSYGEGYFGASRGKRKHLGIDYCCYPGSVILSPVSGVVSKVGYTYADDLSFRYVEVTAVDKLRYRIFYIEPCVSLDDHVLARETALGVSQTLGYRYPADENHPSPITEHVHFEVRNHKGEYFNPEEVLLL